MAINFCKLQEPCQGDNVAASMQMYDIPGKRPCGLESRVMLKRPWMLTWDTVVYCLIMDTLLKKISRICSDIVAGVVTKCLNARPKTKEASIQVCLMCVEIEQHAIVQVSLSIYNATFPRYTYILCVCILYQLRDIWF